MQRVVRTLAVGAMVLGLTAGAYAGTGGIRYEEGFIPRFNIPKMTKPPTIDGKIDPAEWKDAAKVMGVVSTGGLEYKDRPVSFYLAWDEQHLYLAYRVDTLTQPAPHLVKNYREEYATGVVRDDSIEIGLFLHDRNKKEHEVSSYLKFVINSLGAGEYMKNYPEIGQVMFNWTPKMKIANRTYTDAAGKHWWEMEVAMDLKDVQMPVPHKAGDKVDIGLFADVKNPNWQWLDYPSASGHLEHYGFPRAVLTDNQPYIQVEEISGLHDEKLTLKSVIFNPTDKPVKVNAALLLQHGPQIVGAAGTLTNATPILDEKRTLDIPAKGSVRFDVAREFPGLPSADRGKGFLKFTVTDASAAQAAPAYSFACNWWGKDKSYAKPAEYKPFLATMIAFNPVNGLLQVSADTLDAPIPAGTKAAGATYKVMLGDKEVKAGKLQYFINQWYDDLIELGPLQPGKYDVTLALVDETGKELLTAKGGFEKQDEAKVFSKWWNNKIGDTEKVLQPFEALRVLEGERPREPHGISIACTRRVYELGSLGLPVQIEANGGPVLSAPARIVLKVGGKEYAVPTYGKVKVTGQKDWRVDFECAPVTVAGVTFSSKGWMEQDGLVELALTYGPGKSVVSSQKSVVSSQKSEVRSEKTEDKGQGATGVEIEELRIEWPVAQDLPDIYMACMGQGGNYSARTIGLVPKGQGQVWNTRDDIGITGSGRRVGNFVGNLWVGTEFRGLFWCADSDRGWEPDGRVPALAVKRVVGDRSSVISDQSSVNSNRSSVTGGTSSLTDNRSPITDHSPSVVMVNNFIGSAAGKAAFRLTEPRTVRFGYNASPFRHLAPGFRINQLSAAGSFSGGKYKVNWDTKQEFFTVLSPPFPDPARWPEYYAFCKDIVHKMMYEGVGADGGFTSFSPQPGASAYYGDRRHTLYTCNQIALRGYGTKSIENPNPYWTGFQGDWLGSDSYETLSKTYRDYMIWLMDKQVKEGGCQHFYFDISFGQKLFKDLAAGFGYRLPDGSIQPETSDTNLREWYKRVWAMMQENGLYPGGVSGHATHGFSLKMLPFTDAILDSEYPMADSIDVYPSDSMIALSCPHSFGVNIHHFGNFMNPTWALMHDAAGGDFRGTIPSYPEFKQWGMSRTDVEFVPYWRNQKLVKEITPGVIASIWKRPPRPGSGQAGSALIAVMNYGPDPLGEGKTRAGTFTVDLTALGIPADALKAGGDRVRIRQFYNSTVQMYYLGSLKWRQDIKGQLLPPIEPKLDIATGAISGFDINYHDVKFLAIDWEEKPVNDAAVKALAKDDALRTRLLDWGFNAAAPVAANLVVADNPAIKVEAWKRTGDAGGRGNSVLLRVTNTGDQPASGTVKLDLKGLDVGVRKVWAEYTAAVPFDGQSVGLCENTQQPRAQSLSYNAYAGEVYVNLPKGQSRVVSIDRY